MTRPWLAGTLFAAICAAEVISHVGPRPQASLAALLKAGRVRKVLCSFPRQVDSYVFDDLYRSGRIELEVVPQGNLAERMRAVYVVPDGTSARIAAQSSLPAFPRGEVLTGDAIDAIVGEAADLVKKSPRHLDCFAAREGQSVAF